ncbi:M20/M25/M40 family metallo-hydrolase, partial [Planctomycetota bacterium]
MSGRRIDRRWRSRLLGGPERLELRTLLSGGALADLDTGSSQLGFPVAGDDYYWTPADTVLEVSAPGLLANDYDPDGHSLEAINFYGLAINLSLKYGFLDMDEWRNDGSFDYTPHPGANGREIFTYTCADPYDKADEATVTIDVGVFNRSPYVVDPIDDVTVDQGAPDTVIDLDAVFDDLDIPTGDTLTYSVTVSPPILPIAQEVSQSSYEYILSNTDPGKSLYTHFGDDRGYHAGTPPPGADHDAARDTIYNHFNSLGLITSFDVIPEIEEVGGTTVYDPPFVNVIGVKLGETYPEDAYLVGAHYDSVSNPGADDNASGVAGVMEIARVLSAHTFDSTLVFVAFDGEEMGLYGSYHYVEYHDSNHNLDEYTGTHDGGDSQSVLVDSTASWADDALVDITLTNPADGSRGVITANTATTITAALSGGSRNSWDAGDTYSVDFFSLLGMVNLDMIAYNQPGDSHDVVSIQDADGESHIKPNLINAINSYSGGVTARDESASGLSDHYYFDLFGIDAVMAIESAMGAVTNNPHYHDATDAVDTPDYIDYEYASKITRGVAGYLAQAAKPLGDVDLLTGDATGNLLTLDYDPSKSGAAVVTVRATDSEGLFVEDSFSLTVNPTTDGVLGRYVFYDDSYFDDGDDSNAIATDKVALLPGDTATFDNYISYARFRDGQWSATLNGIMIDIVEVPGGLSASDFVFKTGNDSAPGGWGLAAAPLSVTVEEDGGVGGSDRVIIIWEETAVQNSNWLQVTVLANANTGLSQEDVFYFGLAAGECGNSTGDAYVDGTDFAGARDNPHNILDRAAIDDDYDYNRDSYVDGSDL